MKKIVYLAALAAVVLSLPSCEGCVRKMSKKATEMALSAVEGVSEAIDEHGERVSEKATDALAAIAHGAGKSIDKMLDEHAADVASAAGRTLVQSLDGLENGVATEYYDKMDNVSIVSAPDGVVASVELLGKISGEPVVDAYLIIDKAGEFAIDFVFEDAGGKEVMTKTAEAVTDGIDKYTVVSFALTGDELAQWTGIASAKIKVAPGEAL